MGLRDNPFGDPFGVGQAPAVGSMDRVADSFEQAGCMPGGVNGQNDENTLYVEGLPPDTRDMHLYRMFSPFGAIAPKGSRAALNSDGSCKGFGFVSFLVAESAQAA